MGRVAPEDLLVRRLTAGAEDLALGAALVREYVEATAWETADAGTAPDLKPILPYLPDYQDFPSVWSAARTVFLVAQIPSGHTAGGVGGRPLEHDAARTCQMNRLWVREAHRGRGLGRGLTLAALREARGLGYSRMVLDVLPSRRRAIALYRSLGFSDTESFHEYDFPMVPLAIEL